MRHFRFDIIFQPEFENLRKMKFIINASLQRMRPFGIGLKELFHNVRFLLENAFEQHYDLLCAQAGFWESGLF